ncbi:hypothetical protein [Janthinobacterium svalbardensis]|uniref:hypothetical protein n=1 Tax=Janthinobacterium svalbardensis TaxID=368607 RepID=UPI002FCD89B1
MSGWWTIISTETPEQMADLAKVNKDAILATWDAGLGGLGWIAACPPGQVLTVEVWDQS